MNTATKFYSVFTGGNFGVPFAPPEVDPVGLIPDHGEVTSWTPPELAVKPGEWEGPLADWVNGNLPVRLCSKRLKDLLDTVAPPIRNGSPAWPSTWSQRGLLHCGGDVGDY